MNHKIGLMLGGGGAKGKYQIGVLKALEEENLLYNISVSSGTSIGAINTILLMNDTKVDYMKKIWTKLDYSNIFSVKRIRKDKLGIYNLDILFNELIQEISIDKIRNSRISGYATASRLSTKPSIINQINNKKLEKEVFHLNICDKPFHAVLASASIPVIFGSIDIDGFSYVDGGLVDMNPIEPLINEGCDIIFNIPIDGKFKNNVYKKFNKNILVVDFFSNIYFNKSHFLDLISTIRFQKGFLDQKEKEGYIVGKIIIRELQNRNILIRNGNYNYWNKPKNYYIVTLNKEE